jgi:putative tryptophan/tyrosine transport system substrate-binding protein
MPGIEKQTREADVAARTLGVSLLVLNATTLSEIEAAFAVLVRQGIGALMSGSDALLFEHSPQVVALAARHAIPTISYGNIADAGGLISYGSSLEDAFRLAGVYTGRILKGEKPADLPVQESTKVELVINLKTANALGVTVPPALLVRADKVIE